MSYLSQQNNPSIAMMLPRPISYLMPMALSILLACHGLLAEDARRERVNTQSPTGQVNVMPIERLLTDRSGRKLNVTILEKQATDIKVRRTSDGKEFTIDPASLSSEDQHFLMGLQPPMPPAESDQESAAPPKVKGADEMLKISVKGAPVNVARLGKGPLGVLFFAHSGSERMLANILSEPTAFAGLVPDAASFFVWEYPLTSPFDEIEDAIAAYIDGDEKKLRPNFKGIATEVLEQVRQKTGIKQFLLVGNSLGAGIVLWDYPELSADTQLQYLLISPTETFMPPLASLRGLKRTMLLADVEPIVMGGQALYPDSFVRGQKACRWINSNTDHSIMERINQGIAKGTEGTRRRDQDKSKERAGADERALTGHIIIGQDLSNELLSRLIKVNLGIEKEVVLSKPLEVGKIQR
jgi:hypothetical protein